MSTTVRNHIFCGSGGASSILGKVSFGLEAVSCMLREVGHFWSLNHRDKSQEYLVLFRFNLFL